MDERVALITGASRGIGREIALALAKEGYSLAINYFVQDEDLLELEQELQSAKYKLYKADVSDYHQVEEMIKSVHKDFKQIDVLVNNAGITKDNLLMRMTEDEFDSVIDVNLKGTFNCIKHISRIMLRQRSGVIINLSSITGVSGNAGQANYSASKAGVIGLTKSVAKELASRNIRVNAIAPGFIQTAMTEKLNEKVKESMLNKIPLKRYGSTEDVANLVVFLASDKSNYITGQVIHVDGGMVM
ncbi:MAG: 3-oxoacyl-[acyl-carrier-protein] reductase [Clostridia bacterium]